jgi:hypothetical protein
VAERTLIGESAISSMDHGGLNDMIFPFELQAVLRTAFLNSEPVLREDCAFFTHTITTP